MVKADAPSRLKRFNSLIDVKGPDECWNYKGKINKRLGYGYFWAGGKYWRAHRYSYWLKHRKIKKWVLHHCDNKRCVNPRHLYDGTPADNNRDMMERGLHRIAPLKGERNGRAVMSWKTVKEIRELYSSTCRNKALLSRRFGIGASQVARIVNKEQWVSP